MIFVEQRIPVDAEIVAQAARHDPERRLEHEGPEHARDSRRNRVGPDEKRPVDAGTGELLVGLRRKQELTAEVRAPHRADSVRAVRAFLARLLDGWGLEDAVIPPERVVDPGGRDGCRAPIPWDATPHHGWPLASTASTASTEPWLPWPPNPETRNAATLAGDDGSILHLYRRLLAARRASPALQGGSFAWLPSPDGTLAWTRTAEDDTRAVLVNFTD